MQSICCPACRVRGVADFLCVISLLLWRMRCLGLCTFLHAFRCFVASLLRCFVASLLWLARCRGSALVVCLGFRAWRFLCLGACVLHPPFGLSLWKSSRTFGQAQPERNGNTRTQWEDANGIAFTTSSTNCYEYHSCSRSFLLVKSTESITNRYKWQPRNLRNHHPPTSRQSVRCGAANPSPAGSKHGTFWDQKRRVFEGFSPSSGVSPNFEYCRCSSEGPAGRVAAAQRTLWRKGITVEWRSYKNTNSAGSDKRGQPQEWRSDNLKSNQATS
jgi:hypothetical protein